MVKGRNKTGLIVTLVLLVIVVLSIAALALVKTNTPATVTTETKTSDTKTETKPDKVTTDTTPEANTSTPAVDPEKLTSVDIEPLGIVVAYSKGTPGFDFAIKKTADKTQYVEFTSADLVGTKCTDDTGLFASIIKNPTSSEDQTTISQTVKVGNDSYGLSLASAGCTSNSELLTKYQTGFKEGFSSLKAL